MGANCTTTKNEMGKEDNNKKLMKDWNSLPKYTKEELKSHPFWILIDGYIANVEDFIEVHPGGKESILPYCTKDATMLFTTSHSNAAVKELEKLIIGTLSGHKDVGKELNDM
ncbi:hypothetical protein ABK040_015110 [Willaertia magna]